MRIEWDRCAEPQADEHDTQVCWDIVTTTISPKRRVPHRRRLPGNAPTIFDGAVAVRYVAPRCPADYLLNGPLEHPNITQAVEYVRRWPEAYRQFRALMDSVHPMINTNVPPELYGVRIGSNSHSDEERFGTMYGTIFDDIGLAQAMVHEMAHNKLRGLGVYVESAQRIVANPPDELYESPIRKDRMRPMSAVLHAQYSFIYVAQLDLKMFAVETNAKKRQDMLILMAMNIPRMELGFDELRINIRVDAIGRQFIDPFYAWCERVIEAANRVLSENKVEKFPLVRTPVAAHVD